VKPAARSVVFVSPEPVSERMTGPAQRALKLAEATAEHCSVTLAAPSPSTFPAGPFRAVETGPQHDPRLAEVIAGHDVAVVQALPSPRQLLSARRHAPRLVADLIAPLALELAEVGEGAASRAQVRWRARQMVAHVASADLVLCSNEKQRDLVIGAALAAGLLDPGDDTPLQRRIVVVPHGLDERPADSGRSQLRANGFAGPDDRVAVWAGGIWSWLDPLTAIRAMERLRPSRPDLKLAFVGLEHPDPVLRRAHEPAEVQARDYVRDRGLERDIAFLPRWLPYEDYLAHLRDADVGVSLNGATLESRYASRTRVLDYLSAGLPVVCTRGDTMSELVDSHDLGCLVDPENVEATAGALDRLTRGEPRRVDDPATLEPFLWRNVARPLVEFCVGDETGEPQPWRSSLAMAARNYPGFVRAVYRTERAGGLTRAVTRRVAGLAKRR
jgi:glycosyltransferase involved in cell wall biosynthesis